MTSGYAKHHTFFVERFHGGLTAFPHCYYIKENSVACVHQDWNSGSHEANSFGEKQEKNVLNPKLPLHGYLMCIFSRHLQP